MAAAAVLALSAGATTATGADNPRVVLETDAGRMVLELELERAPLTVCNFLGYVTHGDYEAGSFFRTVVSATNDNPNPIDVIQAATPRGSDDDSRPPIPLERTRDTGLSHVAGAISMARDGPDTATSSFFIVTRDTPSLDFGGGRNPDRQGFAAFGRVVEGLDVARAIQMSPADGEEQLTPPVKISAATLIGDVPAECRP
ncbi:MAG: peptidylprolyl isomerase [Alphaproteobacteria bacterium]|nr:peptidylprolyl isomerase [Alphaproteobacteria bacterium]MBU2271413.1 peptidylprolyl isomerase [Alphaproteobacteria bacterium]